MIWPNRSLAGRTELIKKAWSSVSAGDWNLSYEFLTGTWMRDIIQEVQADDQWVFHNRHEQGDTMLAEEMELHDDLDYDDDTALDCSELSQALQDLETADLDDEHNIVAPFVGEDTPHTRNGVEVAALDDLYVNFIDVDTFDLELPSNSEAEADLIMDSD